MTSRATLLRRRCQLAKAICEPYDIGQPTAKCQFRGPPGESWLHDEASSCPCRVEQKTVSSDGGRYAPQNGEIVGILKRLKDETSADLTALEKKGLDRKTNQQDLTKAKTEEICVLTKAIGEKETVALKVEQSAKEVAQRPPPWRDKCNRGSELFVACDSEATSQEGVRNFHLCLCSISIIWNVWEQFKTQYRKHYANDAENCSVLVSLRNRKHVLRS